MTKFKLITLTTLFILSEIGLAKAGTSEISTPPDVSNHKNIHLLPADSDCGFFHPRDRIINTNVSALFNFPWMTLLSYQTSDGPDFRCAGALINEKYILTSAHCITNLENLTLLGVRLGENNISSAQDCEMDDFDTVCSEPVQDLRVEEIIPHPNYNFTTFNNNIGLLRLSSPAEFKESVQPICLPKDEYPRNMNFTNKPLTVSGWGPIDISRTRSENLLKVQIRGLPVEECKIAYKNTPAVINDRQLCGGGKNQRNACGGDSGGPLQSEKIIDNDLRVIQYGIVSFGPGNCGQEGLPAVYTRIDYYMDWILDNIRA